MNGAVRVCRTGTSQGKAQIQSDNRRRDIWLRRLLLNPQFVGLDRSAAWDARYEKNEARDYIKKGMRKTHFIK